VKYENQVYDAWLAAAELPCEWLIPLLYETKGSREAYEAFAAGDASVREMIPPQSFKALSGFAREQAMEGFREASLRHGIKSMTILDAEYPHCLRDIPDPPGILFYQGNPECLTAEKRVAMVGSRTASYAGLKASRKIARELSRGGVTVISGLAYGIDAECHRGCLEGGSPTAAVMGCGLDNSYPAENSGLKQEIIDHGGIIISEYAPGAKPIGRHFPYRNRIISGLGDVVILMEAKIRSGSMTTIGHALKQGREVYAYPGDPTSLMTEANRTLLREGARYFTEAEDILNDMDWLDKSKPIRQNIGCSAPEVPENAHEKAVVSALARGALGFDELIQATGLDPSELMGTLTMLQIKKLIEILPGKKYQLRT